MATDSYLFSQPSPETVASIGVIGERLGVVLNSELAYQLAGAITAMNGYTKAPNINPFAWMETMIEMAAEHGEMAIKASQGMYLGCAIEEAVPVDDQDEQVSSVVS